MTGPQVQIPTPAPEGAPCPKCGSVTPGVHFGNVVYIVQDCGCLELRIHGGEIGVLAVVCPDHKAQKPTLFGGDGQPL